MRAEELIAEIYRQKMELQEQGKKPSRLILSPEAWRHIRAWHLARGVMEKAPHMDYIQENSVFGLEVFFDDLDAPIVH